ncbi:MAG: COG1615 family transporter [Synechococcaceae cyanobacterium RL_1_2]|nr:COG1615 family transporter [Synechococcaceae cyanobacterium RL_1_2]
MDNRWSQKTMVGIAIAMGAYLLWELGAKLFAENTWFHELNYGDIFWERLSLQMTIVGIVFTFSLVFYGEIYAWPITFPPLPSLKIFIPPPYASKPYCP